MNTGLITLSMSTTSYQGKVLLDPRKLRADASRALKEAVPRFYGAAFDNDGKLDRAKADALIPSMPWSFCFCTVADSTQLVSMLKQLLPGKG